MSKETHHELCEYGFKRREGSVDSTVLMSHLMEDCDLHCNLLPQRKPYDIVLRAWKDEDWKPATGLIKKLGFDYELIDSD